MSGKKISIVIVDDHPVIRHGAKAILDKQKGLTVVGVCSDAETGLKTIVQVQPDVVVLDISMVGLSGIDLIPYIIQKSPESAVVIYSVHDHNDYIHRAITAGAKGYILKGDEIEELVTAIRDVHQGRMYLSRNLPANILNQLINGTTEAGTLDSLTPREIEIANLLSQGMIPVEIGKTLKVSHKTARVHRSNIMRKLGIKHTNELLLYLHDCFSDN